MSQLITYNSHPEFMVDSWLTLIMFYVVHIDPHELMSVKGQIL